MSNPIRQVYQCLPLQLRDRVRWVKFPRKTFAEGVIYRKVGRQVASGPFAGMTIPYPGPFLPYLLGTYELEIHDIVEQQTRIPYDLIVNVGAGAGYYVIGMALRCPRARFVAFDMDPIRRDQLLATAQANGVADRIQIAGRCELSDLAKALAAASRPLVIVDVEGFETELLNPEAICKLRCAPILLETHDIFAPGSTRVIQERFRGTHRIDAVSNRPRTLDDFPVRSLASQGFLQSELVNLMCEERVGPQEWYMMTPLKSCGAPE